MTAKHELNVTEFTIQGFFGISDHWITVFLLFLIAYLIIICGNITIIGAICAYSHLHTPMYIFLLNLSIMDLASTSCTLPKLLSMLCTKRNTISFAGCITQMYVFVSLACAEVILLAVMAYDRYIAICHPFRYVVIMNLRYCVGLCLATWIVSLLDLSGHASIISKMSFCASHVIDHFFCDLTQVLQISCTDKSIVEVLNYIEGTIFGIFSFLLTLISYIFIISTILKIKSSQGRRKAFSTCVGHLSCVLVFYSTLICSYMRSTSNDLPNYNKFFSLLYAVLVPMVNPVIYSLKNEEVKKALRSQLVYIFERISHPKQY